MEKILRSQTPHYPTYENVRYFLKLIDGVPKSQFFHMRSEIDSQKGDPQHPVNWTNPDEWIHDRLSGEDQKLALKIWEQSEKELNPRYLRGEWYLSQRHNLSSEDGMEIMQITPRGEAFINNENGQVVAEVDQFEGVLIILQLVAELGPGKRSAFLSKYADYSHNFTHDQSENVIKSRMYARLNNLRARGFIEMNVHTYEITELGLSYLEKYSQLITEEGLRTQTLDIERLAKQHRENAKKELSNYLLEMDPFKFEDLVKFLLEEMGYIDVKVTSPINDKGVDVLAKIEMGISSLKEVIQVKRHRGNLGRTVLDLLRGSLHRFDAVRGTIITTSGFSSGAIKAAHERGAAPITLIDGDRLLDLLIENRIGIKQHEVKYFEFDPASLIQFEVDTEVEEEL